MKIGDLGSRLRQTVHGQKMSDSHLRFLKPSGK